MLPFLIVWLLCTVAFVIAPEPNNLTTVGVLKAAAAGALVAISIVFIPAMIK
jgi:hypothetical protein